MNVYFISGLGCDRRAFQRISLPAGYEAVYLDWILPEKDERIEDYAKRLAEPIDASQPFILTGLSFGGMVAIEICKFKRPEKLLLISSVTCRSMMPALYRLCGLFYLDKITPADWLKRPNRLLYRAFGPLDHETRPLFDTIINETDPVFLKWAIGVIVRWKNTTIPPQLLQIHGDRDRIFPCPPENNAKILKTGGHFAVYTHSSEINDLLREYISAATLP